MARLVNVRDEPRSVLGAPCDRQNGAGGLPCRNLAVHKVRLLRDGLHFDVNACEDCFRHLEEHDADSIQRTRPLWAMGAS